MKCKKIPISSIGTQSVEWSNLKIGKLKIPRIDIGQGRPRLLMTAGVHGDEYSQQLVLQLLIATPPRFKKGTITILPRLNPLGLASDSELNPADGKNINRVFPGKQRKATQSEKIAAAVFELARASEAVIDLHNFTDPALAQTIFVDSGSAKIRSRSLELCQSYGLPLVWRIRPNNPQANGTLIYNAARAGIPAIGVEMPPVDFLLQSDIEKARAGLDRIICVVLSGKLGLLKKRPLTLISRLNITAPRPGIFIPMQPLGKKLRTGAILGRIILNNYQEIILKSPQAGLLTRIRRAGPVVKKQLLLNIGINQKKL